MVEKSSWNNADYLKSQQYNNASNLGARIRLHELYSTNDYDFMHWIFDHVLENAKPGMKLLEVGSGRGDLWKRNLDRIPDDWHITLSDFSDGMLKDCKANLNDSIGRFTFEIIEVQNIPYKNNTFDLVVANAMLYHVPDRPKGIAELRRVLKPDGYLHAVTMGDNHMRRLDEIAVDVLPHFYDARGYYESPFTLENGGEQLRESFGDVNVIRYDCDLNVTEVQPLMDYVASMRLSEIFTEDDWAALETHFNTLMARDGVIHIPKDAGTFIASGYNEA